MNMTTEPGPGPAPARAERRRKLLSWGYLITLTVLSGYFFIFVEWLFDVTRPSFMSLMTFGTKLGILLLSGLLLSGLCLPVLLVLWAASLVPFWSRHWKVFLWAGGLLPALLLGAGTLLMVDQITYTVFKFGIVTTVGLGRGIYGLLFAAMLIGFARWVIRSLSRQARRKRWDSAYKAQAFASAGILLLSVPLGLSLYSAGADAVKALPNTGAADSGQAVTRPNILLIGTDGLNAEFLSLYGSRRSTTPFLEEFAEGALLSQNNFSNANLTTGSLVSMFTGKLPTETRLLFPPDILKGADAFQHLPGILKREGYYNAQISVDYYGDADTANLQDAFVTINGRMSAASGLYTFTRQYAPEDTAFFMSTIARRLSDRLAHISYIRTMPNPYAQVTQPLDNSSDQERVNQALFLFRNIQQPLFVHVYMMGTHIYMYDSFDDAVREFDSYLRTVVEELERMGKLEQTIIIVYTDHAKDNERNVRLPLLIRFPNREYAGKTIHANTQNMDIGPTLLDYLGIEQPDWMGGQSLLAGDPPADRPIFSAVPNYRKDNAQGRLELDASKIKPPFYQFGTIDMLICHRWYAVDTTSLSWETGAIRGYPTPCSPESMPDDRQAVQILLDRLAQDGFDIAALETALERQIDSRGQ